MDTSKYTEKCLEVLSTKQFTVVENDPTKTLESKIKLILRNLKSKITDQEYKGLYPTGSQSGKCYGIAKMHKLPVNGNLNHLPLRPIVSNTNTSTPKPAKFLSKLLSPLCQSDRVRSSAANKYLSSAGHHEQKNKTTTGQIKFSVVTIKQ